jgi:transcription elongation factor GreA
MNSTARRIRLSTSGRKRLRAELISIRAQIDALDLRLKEELQHKDDLNWYVTAQELATLRHRSAELESTLASEPENAERTPGKVHVGSRVVVRDESGKEHTFTIVHPIEVDAGKGFISHESPIGSALVGRGPGDSVDIPIPRGVRRFDLLSVA